MRNSIRIGGSVVILLFFLAHVLNWQSWTLIQRIDNILYDLRLAMSASGRVDPRIVVVDIDEKSLAVEGRWPWNRDRVAHLVDTLFEYYHIDLAGLDMVFAETTENSGMQVLKQISQSHLGQDPQWQTLLASIQPGLEHDRIFANALKNRAVVMGFTESDQTGVTGALPPALGKVEDLGVEQVNFFVARGLSGNLPVLMQNAASAGIFSNPAVDASDGVYRRTAMLLTYQDQLYPALSLAMLNLYLDNPGIGLVIHPQSPNILDGIKVGQRIIPTDERGAMLVPYQGPAKTFRYVSALDVLQRRLEPSALDGAIVLVGTSAPGLQDLRSTPVGATYPGVEVHANLLAGMLNHYVSYQPAYTLVINALLLLLLGIAMTVIFLRVGPGVATGVFVASTLLVLGLSQYLWQHQVVLPLSGLLLGLTSLFVFHAIYGFFTETLNKRHLAYLFGQYVPEELVDEMAKNPQQFSLAGQQKEMTVLFSDVRGFTTISTGMDPTALSQLMNEFLTPLTQVIHQHKGTIDKYMGDAVMAFWNAPLDDPHHAEHAVLAGMEMIRVMRQMAPDFKARGLPELTVGVGINTGQMNVGNMGSEFRMAYTVLGDAVNLGSRLEGVTKEYGVDLIVGQNTKEATPNLVYRELDRVQVKGRPLPVAIYEPLGLRDGIDELTWRALQRFADALALYRKREWKEAEVVLMQLKAEYPPHKVYDVYLERVRYFQQNYQYTRKGDPETPTENWDGVFKLVNK